MALLVLGVPAIAGVWLLASSAGVGFAIAGMNVCWMACTPEAAICAREPGGRGTAAGLKAAFDVGGSFLAFLVIGILLAGGDGRAVAGLITLLLVADLVLVLLFVPVACACTTAATSLPDSGKLPAGFTRLVVTRGPFLLGVFIVARFLLLLVADRLGLDP